MNINVILGILSFTVWSAFSTWYYVTQILGFPKPGPAEKMSVEIPVSPVDSLATIPPIDTLGVKPVIKSFVIEREFLFEKRLRYPNK